MDTTPLTPRPEPRRGSARRPDAHRITAINQDGTEGTCQVCGPVKVYARARASGKPRHECMTLRHGRAREYEKTRTRVRAPYNPEAGRRRWLRKKYGITVEQYDEMVAAQDGRCAICGDAPEQLYVDHCHSTGVVRGLLCHGCNSGIGFLRDHPEILTAAIGYLSRPIAA